MKNSFSFSLLFVSDIHYVLCWVTTVTYELTSLLIDDDFARNLMLTDISKNYQYCCSRTTSEKRRMIVDEENYWRDFCRRNQTTDTSVCWIVTIIENWCCDDYRIINQSVDVAKTMMWNLQEFSIACCYHVDRNFV